MRNTGVFQQTRGVDGRRLLAGQLHTHVPNAPARAPLAPVAPVAPAKFKICARTTACDKLLGMGGGDMELFCQACAQPLSLPLILPRPVHQCMPKMQMHATRRGFQAIFSY